MFGRRRRWRRRGRSGSAASQASCDQEAVLAGDRVVARRALHAAHVFQRPGVGLARRTRSRPSRRCPAGWRPRAGSGRSWKRSWLRAMAASMSALAIRPLWQVLAQVVVARQRAAWCRPGKRWSSRSARPSVVPEAGVAGAALEAVGGLGHLDADTPCSTKKRKPLCPPWQREQVASTAVLAVPVAGGLARAVEVAVVAADRPARGRPSPPARALTSLSES